MHKTKSVSSRFQSWMENKSHINAFMHNGWLNAQNINYFYKLWYEMENRQLDGTLNLYNAQSECRTNKRK